MSAPTTGHCEECGVIYPLNATGRVRRHTISRTTPHGQEYREKCNGGGWWPASAEDVAKACPAPSCRKPGTHRGLHDIPAGVKP